MNDKVLKTADLPSIEAMNRTCGAGDLATHCGREGITGRRFGSWIPAEKIKLFRLRVAFQMLREMLGGGEHRAPHVRSPPTLACMHRRDIEPNSAISRIYEGAIFRRAVLASITRGHCWLIRSSRDPILLLPFSGVRRVPLAPTGRMG